MKREGDIASARVFIAVSFMVTVSLSASLSLSLYRIVPDQQNVIASYMSHHTESISEPHGTDKQEFLHKHYRRPLLWP